MNPVILAPTTLMRTEPREYVEAAIKAGYDGVGLRLYPSPGMFYSPIVGNPTLMREVKTMLGDAGMRVYEGLTCYLQPEMDIGAMQRSMEYAGELGSTYFLIIGDDPEWGRMVDSFGMLCDIAAQYNIVAAIEAPVNTRVVNSMPKVLKLIADAGRENAVACLDPVQYFRAGHTVAELKGIDPSLLPYSQLCDGTEMKFMAQYCMPGDGIFPLRELLDVLPANLPLSVEYHLRDPDYPAVAWAKHVLDGTRRFLRQYYDSKMN